jgi:hypothetical protein
VVAARRHARGAASGEPDLGAGPDGDDGDGERLDGGTYSRRWAWVALAGALAPIVLAAGRAVTAGWVPVGDPALVAVGAADVLDGGSVPGVGPWAATSLTLGVEVHHPGPLLFDALAPFVRWGGDAGLALGAALINAIAVVGIFVTARRLDRDGPEGGATTAALAMVLVAVLCWVMGPATLVEPGYPGIIVLPFLWFLVLVWAVLCGRRWCLPWACLVGALVAGTDLRVALFVPVLLAVSAVVVAAGAWGLPVRRWGPAAGTLAVSGLVIAVCVAQPVAEEVGADGPGNMARLWQSVGDVPTLAAAPSARVLARMVALPPWWVRPWQADDLGVGPRGAVGPPLWLAVVALVGLSVQGVVRLRYAHRRGDRVVATGITVALAALGLAFLTLLLVPTTRFGTAVPQLRWLAGVAVFVSLVLFVAGYRWLFKPRPGGRWWPAAACAGVALVAAVATVPAHERGATATPTTSGIAREITGEVAGAGLAGPVAVVCDEALLDPYCEAVLAELAVERVRLSGEAERVVVVAVGDAVERYNRGWQAIAGHRALSVEETNELARLRTVLEGAITSGGISLNRQGREVAARGDLPSVGPGPDGAIDPVAATGLRTELFGAHRRDLVAMIAYHLLSADNPWPGTLRRYRELQDRADSGNVAVLVGQS